MNRTQEIQEKMIKDGKYLKISIDRNGSLYTPDSKLDYPGSGILTVYRENLKELVKECNNNESTNYYGSPYGNHTCEWN